MVPFPPTSAEKMIEYHFGPKQIAYPIFRLEKSDKLRKNAYSDTIRLAEKSFSPKVQFSLYVQIGQKTTLSPLVFIIKSIVLGEFELLFFILTLQSLAFQMIYDGGTYKSMLESMLLDGIAVIIVRIPKSEAFIQFTSNVQHLSFEKQTPSCNFLSHFKSFMNSRMQIKPISWVVNRTCRRSTNQ